MASIKSALVSIIYAVNSLLPFTRHGTPLIQDIIHTLALCGLLYFVPGFLEDYTERRLALDAAYRDGQATGSETRSRAQEPWWIMLFRSVEDSIVWVTKAAKNYHQPHDSDKDDPQEPSATPIPAEAQIPVQDGPHEANDHGLSDNEGAGPDAPHTPPQAHSFPQPQRADLPAPEDDQAVPAHPPPNLAQAAEAKTRNVGAKKAKSLARKDQRRAYHEFMRSRGNAQREKEEEEAKAREAVLVEERRRRFEFVQSVKERERAEREARKEALRQEQEDERRFRERLIKGVKDRLEEVGCCDLGERARQEGFEVEEARRLVRAAGLVRDEQDEHGRVVCRTIVTASGWVVRVDELLMREVLREVEERDDVGDEDGKVGWEDIGVVLEGFFKRRMKSAAP